MAALAVTLFALASCQKETKLFSSPSEEFPSAKSGHAIDDSELGVNSFGSGNKHVYTLSNQVSGNSVVVYNRAANGRLTYSASYATGGTGTGGGLGNQGAIIMAGDDNDEDLPNGSPHGVAVLARSFGCCGGVAGMAHVCAGPFH